MGFWAGFGWIYWNRREPGAEAIAGPLAVRDFGVMVRYNTGLAFASWPRWGGWPGTGEIRCQVAGSVFPAVREANFSNKLLFGDRKSVV